jgi:hypothetical protein
MDSWVAAVLAVAFLAGGVISLRMGIKTGKKFLKITGIAHRLYRRVEFADLEISSKTIEKQPKTTLLEMVLGFSSALRFNPSCEL